MGTSNTALMKYIKTHATPQEDHPTVSASAIRPDVRLASVDHCIMQLGCSCTGKSAENEDCNGLSATKMWLGSNAPVVYSTVDFKS